MFTQDSDMLSTRKTPARLKAASSTASLPVRLPVWEAAALAAASVRPPLMTWSAANLTGRTIGHNGITQSGTFDVKNISEVEARVYHLILFYNNLRWNVRWSESETHTKKLEHRTSHNDRLGQGALPRCGEEIPGIANGLHVEHDALGGCILR